MIIFRPRSCESFVVLLVVALRSLIESCFPLCNDLITSQRLFETTNPIFFTKDAFHRYVIDDDTDAVSPSKKGTKAAAHYVLTVPAGGQYTIRCRLSAHDEQAPFCFGESFVDILEQRKMEADKFYKTVIPGT